MHGCCGSPRTARAWCRSMKRRCGGRRRGDIEIVRVGDFVAFVGADETVVQRAAVAAPAHAELERRAGS